MTGPRIPYGRQDINDDDVAAVSAVLRSDFLTQGPAVPEFESALAAYLNAKYVVACSNATAALHMACLALELGPGDRLWTSPITFVASANCGLYCGALVDFVDIDPITYNMSTTRLAEKLAVAEANGTLPKVVVPVHLSGEPCDMRTISELGKRYGFRIIEDASHAIGARYGNSKVGSCEYSDITVFSFHPVKIITTGEGGAAVTSDLALAEKLSLFRSHGITRDPKHMREANHDAWYYEQIFLGFNYRLTDLQAALGTSQLARLDSFVARRHVLASRYDSLLSGLPLILPRRDPKNYSALHLYIIRVPQQQGSVSRKLVIDKLSEQNIGVNVHYIPVHMQPYYRERGHSVSSFPAAENYYEEAITLPLFPLLTEAEQLRVVGALSEIFE